MNARLPALLVAACLPVIAVAEPPPVSAFTNFAKYESVTISPLGNYLAITRRLEKHEGLTVLTLPDLKVSGQTHFGDRMDIETVQWASDRRLLVQPTRRFLGFTAGKFPTGEIIGLDVDMKRPELLFGFAAGKMQTGTHVKQRESSDLPARLLAAIPGDPKNVLIQTFGGGIEGGFNAAYRMDVYSGKLARVAVSPVRDGRFVVDFDHRAAVVTGRDGRGNTQLYYRQPKSDEWTLVDKGDVKTGSLYPVAPWNGEGEYLALGNREAPTLGVYAYSPATGNSRLLFRKPEVDVQELRTDPAGKPWMFIYEDHYPGYWYPDDQHPLAQAHKWLREKFGGRLIDFESTTTDMKRAVVSVSSPREPPVFIYADLENRKLLQSLVAYPELKPADLAEVEPFEFNARDGLKVRGYLTVPNAAVKKKLPMIVAIHGGPHGIYDSWGFNYEAQLFASRGYAVLQVNYRGSGGRGRSFEVAGYGKWGAEMQDDVTDAVRWAIGDGVADAERICIYGGSYGAYSALTGAFREPGMFRCAVGLAGVYDLPLMFQEGDIQSESIGVNYLRDVLGTDMEVLKKRSPVYNADKIRIPVLLLHGKDDERAPIEHALRMRAALEKAGNPPEWYTASQEAHGFTEEGNRREAYERVLAFFAKHLAVAASGT